MPLPSLPSSPRTSPPVSSTPLPLPPSRVTPTPARPNSALATGHADLGPLRRTRSNPETSAAQRPRTSASLQPLAPLAPADPASIAHASMELFDVLDDPAQAPQRKLIARIGDDVMKGMRFVANNEATSATGQALNSVANIAARNLISVGLTTEVRQLMTAVFKAGFDKHLSPQAQTALAMTVIAVPMLLNLVGAYADHHDGTGTARSWAGRGMNLALGISAVALAATAGTTADNAAQCVSTVIYCAIRDAVQASLRLPDDSDGQHLAAVGLTGALYVPNQLAVNRGMTVYGSPSGASAAGRIGERAGKDVVRAGINTAGETVDDVVDMALHAMLQGKPFKVRLEAGLPTAQQAMDKLLRMGSARPAVFISSLLLNNLVDQCLVALPPEQRQGLLSTITAAVPGADKCLVPSTLLTKAGISMVSDVTFATLIGLLRIPQVLQAGQKDRPAPAERSEA